MIDSFADLFDDPEETPDPTFGMHIDDGSMPTDEPVTCEWDAGDSEGMCTVDRWPCYVLGCPHSRVES